MSVAGHTLTQKSRIHAVAASGCRGRVLLLPAWDCTSYDCLGFYILVLKITVE